MTNNNYKHNTNISDSVSSTDTNTSGVFTLSAWLPFLQSVTRFLVSLVYGPSPSPAADHHIDAADDRTDSVDETFDDDQCSLIDSLIDASLLFPRPSSLRRRGITRNRTPPEQPESFLHTSLLELIAMEAPQCMAAPAQLAHGIGAAVDLYLGGQPEQTIARSPGRTSGRFTQKRMDKRKHVLQKQEQGSGGGHIVWPKCRSPTSPPATTMHTLAKTLNVKPVHKHANKNRREKERHVLTRYINDDLYDADLRQHDSTAGVDDVDVDVAFDTVDFCIVRSPASVSAIACAASTLNICLNLPESKLQQQSFACFTHEDFPEMRPKATAAHAATAATANTTTALIVDSDAPIAAVVSITVTAVAPASYTPSLSWEISADELRTPSKRPGGMRKIAAAAVCIVDSYAPIAATSAITTQYQQLLLAGLRPHRERQISECSDDFICFERDDDAGSEGSICYDIADDSSDSDEMEDDDDEDDDDSEDGSDDDSDDDEVDNGHSKTAHVESDDDSESDSESETNSATHQLDSGFEENKVNKVRISNTSRCHMSTSLILTRVRFRFVSLLFRKCT